MTVNNVTVIITEFQPKQKKMATSSTSNEASHGVSSSEAGSISDTSTDTRNGEIANESRSS